VFLINRGKLEGRFDSQFYVNKGEFSKFVYLKKYISVKGGKRIPKGFYYSVEKTNFSYLRVDNINNDGSIDDNLKFILREVFEILKRYAVQNNDVIISIAGTIGKVALVCCSDKENIVLTENCAKFIIKNGINLLPEYLALILQLSIVKKQIIDNSIQTTIPKLALERILNLQVPEIPDIKTQIQYINVIKKASQSQKQKLAEAQALLDSIDDYLLTELGIKRPVSVENSVNNRIFTRKFSEISGRRFDAFYYQEEYEDLDKNLSKSSFEIHKLLHLIIDLKNGVEIRNYVENGYRYLRVSDLSKNGIVNHNPRFVEAEKIPDRLKLDYDCILISRSGSLGLVNIVTDETIDSILSSHIFKVKLNTKLISPVYLEAYLRSSLGQKQFFRQNNGGVIPEINQAALKSIKIPLPPIEKQTEIADHIQRLRQRAKHLQQQAKTELQQAKIQVEKMILGENNKDLTNTSNQEVSK